MKTKDKYIQRVVATHIGRGIYEVKAQKLLAKAGEEKLIKETSVDFIEPTKILFVRNLEEYSRRIMQISEELALSDYEIGYNNIYTALITAAARAKRNFPTVLTF